MWAVGIDVVECVKTSLERLAAMTICTPGARRGPRHRIDQRAVDQPAVADQVWREDARQRVGAHRIHHRAVGQPDLVAGAHSVATVEVFHRQFLIEHFRARLPVRPQAWRRRSGPSRSGGCRCTEKTLRGCRLRAHSSTCRRSARRHRRRRPRRRSRFRPPRWG